MKGREVRIVRNDCNLRIKYWWANTCILVSFVGPCRRRMSSWGYVHLRELCQPLTVGPWTFNSNEECLSSSPEKMNYSFTFVKLQFKCKKKKKNKSNIILKKNHNYREYLNFFSSSSKNIIFLLQKKNCTSLHAFSSSSFLVFTLKSILTLRDCILLWIKMEKISTQSIIVLTSWKLYSDGPLKMWYDSSRDILVIKITIVIEEYRNDVIVNI